MHTLMLRRLANAIATSAVACLRAHSHLECEYLPCLHTCTAACSSRTLNYRYRLARRAGLPHMHGTRTRCVSWHFGLAMRPENVMLYLQRPMGVAWPLLLAALCRCPLAPLASWDAQKCLQPEEASEVRTGCRKLSLWQAQQMSQGMQWTLVRHCWGAAHCWAWQGLARRPEMARTGAPGRHPDQAPRRAARAPGPGRARAAAARSAPETCGRRGLRRDCWMGWAGWRGCPGSFPGRPPGLPA